MSIRNLIFGVNSVTVLDLICYDSLLQNATDVTTKCDSCFIAKRDISLLQNPSGLLLQNVTVLLQNVPNRKHLPFELLPKQPKSYEVGSSVFIFKSSQERKSFRQLYNTNY